MSFGWAVLLKHEFASSSSQGCAGDLFRRTGLVLGGSNPPPRRPGVCVCVYFTATVACRLSLGILQSFIGLSIDIKYCFVAMGGQDAFSIPADDCILYTLWPQGTFVAAMSMNEFRTCSWLACLVDVCSPCDQGYFFVA